MSSTVSRRTLLRNLSGVLLLVSAFLVLGTYFAGLTNTNEDPCVSVPLPSGAVRSGEAIAHNSNHSYFPLGWVCTYKMQDGTYQADPLEGWPATWIFYSSLLVLVASVPVFIASYETRRKITNV